VSRMFPNGAGGRGARPNGPAAPLAPRRNRAGSQTDEADHGRLGVTVQDLTPQLRAYFGAAGGALVSSVVDHSPAEAAGLKAGDVITRVNGQAVSDAADLSNKIDAASGHATLSVVRDKRERTVTADLGSEGSASPRTIVK
jgi:S1-C subfamily serine protease